jgi:hypothetical protein
MQNPGFKEFFIYIFFGMLDAEIIEDIAKIVIKAIRDKVQVNLIINNPAGGKAP